MCDVPPPEAERLRALSVSFQAPLAGNPTEIGIDVAVALQMDERSGGGVLLSSFSGMLLS